MTSQILYTHCKVYQTIAIKEGHRSTQSTIRNMTRYFD